MALTPDQAATASAEMSAQRSQELAGNDRHYRLRKACAVRAVEMFALLERATHEVGNALSREIAATIKEIEHDAQQPPVHDAQR